MADYLQITNENLSAEHLCCAIADKKHQAGVAQKKAWLQARLQEGHVFYKLDEKGKVFIEYASVETAWVPVEGEGYVYIYCLWVSGQYKGQGHGRRLLEHCLADARARGARGVCAIAGMKKKPFHSDGAFLKRLGFVVADTLEDGYQLLALPLKEAPLPRFCDAARENRVMGDGLTIHYSPQCPYIPNCLEQLRGYCAQKGLPLSLHPVTSAAEARAVPCVFNNWAVFYQGCFLTTHLLNAGYLEKQLSAIKKEENHGEGL